jgi:hypothetical protein
VAPPIPASSPEKLWAGTATSEPSVMPPAQDPAPEVPAVHLEIQQLQPSASQSFDASDMSAIEPESTSSAGSDTDVGDDQATVSHGFADRDS